MKKILVVTILFSLKFFAQNNVNGGVPILGLKTISKTDTFLNVKKSDNTIQTNEQPSPSLPTGNSSEVGVTKGQLSVSLTGSANYDIPLSIPPGINQFVPKLSISYNSQSGNGYVGYGWNISGISMITRIPSTMYHDGVIDPVDFDVYDRFALNGQRLIIKNGSNAVYGENGTVYELENYSNIKITSFGINPYGVKYGPNYFLVEYPDGSIAQYGNSSNSQSGLEWGLSYYQNPQGARINYFYDSTGGGLKLSTVTYGSLLTNNPVNSISFIYKNRKRSEQAYIGGSNYSNSQILDKINVLGNGVGFRNYFFDYEETSLGYERLVKITEKSGDNLISYNPTIFTYDTTTEIISYNSIQTNLSNSNTNYNNSRSVSGDFDGDGKMDFILYPTTGSQSKSKYSFFSGINGGNLNIGFEHNVGAFDELFPISWIGGSASFGYKLMPTQGWCVIKNNTTTNSTTSFTNYSKGNTNPILLQDVKNYIFPKFNSNTTELDYTGNIASYLKLIPKKFISGDFNGDGITDVLALELNTFYNLSSSLRTESDNSSKLPIDGGVSTYNYSGQTFLVNLDKRVSTNFVSIVGQLNIYNGDNLIVDDVDGDGKSELLVFSNAKVKVYTLGLNNQLNLLWTTSDQIITLNNPILMGDYNG